MIIDDTIQFITTKLPPSDGGNLLGMNIDIAYAFNDLESAKLISYEQTGDNSCMFLIELEVSCSAKDLGSVFKEVLDAKRSCDYSHFNANSSMYYDEKSAVYRYVTVPYDESYYVTGRIIISGERYQQLYKK